MQRPKSNIQAEGDTKPFATQQKITYLSALTVICAAAVLVIISALSTGPQTQAAAPALIPTPLSDPAQGGGDPANVVFFAADTITADTRSNSLQLIDYTVIEPQVIIDVGLTQTLTLRQDFSNDPLCVTSPASAEWSNGPNIVATVTADQDNVYQLNNYARCTSIFADVAEVNPVTLTIRAVAR